MFESSTLGPGLWLWLPFLSSQGMGYGQLPPLDGAWFDGIGGEQESGADWARTTRPESDVSPMDAMPRFSRERRLKLRSCMFAPLTLRPWRPVSRRPRCSG